MLTAHARRSVVIALATVPVALAGCGREPPQSPAAPPAPAQERAAEHPAPAAGPTRAASDGKPGGSYSFNAYSYDCGELRVVVEPREGGMTLYLPDRSVLLPQVVADSGARYAEGDVGFWGKGINTATLTLAGEDVPCRLNRQRTPWDAARLRGVAFRAVGQEPGWLMEIGEAGIEILRDYGQSRLAMPLEGEPPGAEAAGWSYADETREVRIEVTRAPCSDPMSGAEYPWTARVELVGQALAGCGRILE